MWRKLGIIVVALALTMFEVSPAGAQVETPPVQITFEIVTTIDLARPGLADHPYLYSYVAETSTDGRVLLVVNAYGVDELFSTDVRYDFSRYDIATGAEHHFSPTWNGEPLDRYIKALAMSDDGSHLAFATEASNVIFGGVGNGHGYYFDVVSATPRLLTIRPDGTHGRYTPDDMAMTPDGRYAVFSTAAGLTPDQGGGVVQVYRWDRLTQSIELVSRNAQGVPANVSARNFNPVAATRPATSDDGQFVSFVSYSTNLVDVPLPGANDPNFPEKAYLKNLSDGAVTLLTQDATGPLNVKSLDARVTGDGSAVVYNNFPFGEAGTAWRWDRLTGERSLLMTGDEDTRYATFTDINIDGTTLELGYGREHYRDGTFIEVVVGDETEEGTLERDVQVTDRSYLWAVRQERTAAGSAVPGLDVLTQSTVTEAPETCGSAELEFAAGERPLDDQVVRLYQAVFGRAPDDQGLHYWIDQRIAGASLEALAAEFTGSTEWANRYGADSSTEETINLLYRNVLDREPDAEGLAFWQASGLTTPQLIVNFSDSQENIRRTSTSPPMTPAEGVVCRLYLGVFGRAPDAGGMEFWTARIDQGQTVQSVAAEFAASPEWAQSYGNSPSPFTVVTGLYSNVFDRAADVGGLRFWVNLADEGLSDAALLEQFVQSAEFIRSTGTAP